MDIEGMETIETDHASSWLTDVKQIPRGFVGWSDLPGTPFVCLRVPIRV